MAPRLRSTVILYYRLLMTILYILVSIWSLNLNGFFDTYTPNIFIKSNRMPLIPLTSQNQRHLFQGCHHCCHSQMELLCMVLFLGHTCEARLTRGHDRSGHSCWSSGEPDPAIATFQFCSIHASWKQPCGAVPPGQNILVDNHCFKPW